MTRETAATEHTHVGMQSAAQRLLGLQVVGMQDVGVALLTQEGNGRQQQRVLIRAMRRMAIQAVLANRGVFEQKRAALLGVALVARLVDRVRFQEGAGKRSERIVAVIAAHLALGERHVRAAVELQPDVLVTLCAGVVDRCLRHQSLYREFRHRVVAIAARQIVALMH